MKPDISKWKINESQVCFVPWLVLTPSNEDFPTEQPQNNTVNIIDAHDEIKPLFLKKYNLDRSKKNFVNGQQDKRKKILKKLTKMCEDKIKKYWSETEKSAYHVQKKLDEECGLGKSAIDRMKLGEKVMNIGGGVANL